MKVKVIVEKCNGCGACEALADEIFEVNDVAEVLVDKVPEEKIQEAEDAIECCQNHAIVKDNDEKTVSESQTKIHK